MSDNEMAIVVLSIIFGSIVAIIATIKIFDVIKAWIERNKSTYDEEQFDRLAKAFIKHKKEMDRRVQNLEAIVTDDEAGGRPASSLPDRNRTSGQQQLGERRSKSIEIETDRDERKPQTTRRDKDKGSDGGNLRNMLKE